MSVPQLDSSETDEEPNSTQHYYITAPSLLMCLSSCWKTPDIKSELAIAISPWQGDVKQLTALSFVEGLNTTYCCSIPLCKVLNCDNLPSLEAQLFPLYLSSHTHCTPLLVEASKTHVPCPEQYVFLEFGSSHISENDQKHDTVSPYPNLKC